jgi:hypothetical protein
MQPDPFSPCYSLSRKLWIARIDFVESVHGAQPTDRSCRLPASFQPLTGFSQRQYPLGHHRDIPGPLPGHLSLHQRDDLAQDSAGLALLSIMEDSKVDKAGLVLQGNEHHPHPALGGRGVNDDDSPSHLYPVSVLCWRGPSAVV